MLCIALWLVSGVALSQEPSAGDGPGPQETEEKTEAGDTAPSQEQDAPSGDSTEAEGETPAKASEAAPQPAEPAGEDAAPPAAPEEPEEAAAPPEVGELYVNSNIPGEIYIDGEPTGVMSPALIPAVPVGDRVVSVRTDCSRQERTLEIRTGLVERSEFTLEEFEEGKPPPSVVEIRSEPEDAMVFLDGENVGNTPWSSESIPCGTHSLEVRHFGYLEHKSTIDASPYEPVGMDIVLKSEKYGTLVVKPDPLESSVSLDGVPQGSGPMTMADIPVGQYSLGFTAEGYDPMEKTVNLKHEQVLTVEVSLYPEGTTPEPPSWNMLASSSLFAGGVALGYLSLDFYVQGRGYFLDYLEIESDSKANSYYDNKVLPYRNLSIATGAGSAALVASGAFLWQKQRLTVAPSSTGLTLFGKW